MKKNKSVLLHKRAQYRIRTDDFFITSETLWPAELIGQKKMSELFRNIFAYCIVFAER